MKVILPDSWPDTIRAGTVKVLAADGELHSHLYIREKWQPKDMTSLIIDAVNEFFHENVNSPTKPHTIQITDLQYMYVVECGYQKYRGTVREPLTRALPILCEMLDISLTALMTLATENMVQYPEDHVKKSLRRVRTDIQYMREQCHDDCECECSCD